MTAGLPSIADNDSVGKNAEEPAMEAPGAAQPEIEGAAVAGSDSSASSTTADNKDKPSTEPVLSPEPVVGAAGSKSEAHGKPATNILKAGQKLRITGFAEDQSTAVVESENSASPPSYHRAHMRLDGSMCYACLHELQEKLLRVWGVERFHVEKAEQVSIQVYAPALPSFADGTVIYDSHKVDLNDLRAYMRSSGYFSYKVDDKEVDSLPPAGAKKI